MKHLFLLLFMVILSQASHAQKGLNIGANFMAYNSNIVNQNTWGNGREYDYIFSFRTSYGLDVGYNISDHFGISSGYWFVNLGQDYEDAYSGSEWDRSLNFSYNVIPLMFRVNGTGSKVNFIGGAGVLFASLKEAEQEWLRDGAPYSEIIVNPITNENFDLGATDVTERYVQNDILINLEVGARILFSDKLFLDATLNFGYGLKDINAPDWQIPNGAGIYDPSHNAYGGLKLGLAYVLFAPK